MSKSVQSNVHVIVQNHKRHFLETFSFFKIESK